MCGFFMTFLFAICLWNPTMTCLFAFCLCSSTLILDHQCYKLCTFPFPIYCTFKYEINTQWERNHFGLAISVNVNCECLNYPRTRTCSQRSGSKSIHARVSLDSDSRRCHQPQPYPTPSVWMPWSWSKWRLRPPWPRRVRRKRLVKLDGPQFELLWSNPTTEHVPIPVHDCK